MPGGQPNVTVCDRGRGGGKNDQKKRDVIIERPPFYSVGNLKARQTHVVFGANTGSPTYDSLAPKVHLRTLTPVEAVTNFPSY
jgi:hypothetical protein